MWSTIFRSDFDNVLIWKSKRDVTVLTHVSSKQHCMWYPYSAVIIGGSQWVNTGNPHLSTTTKHQLVKLYTWSDPWTQSKQRCKIGCSMMWCVMCWSDPWTQSKQCCKIGCWMICVMCMYWTGYSLSVKSLAIVLIDFKRYPSTYCLMQGRCFICSNF